MEQENEMMIGPGDKRMEIAACLSVIHRGETAGDLSIFCSVDEEDAFLQKVGEMREFADGEQSLLVKRMKFLADGDEFMNLADIHPAWLVDVLSKEPPRIIGIILRYLPSSQVRYIIEHLPKRIKQRLPQIIDSFAVPAPILKIIRERFERQFASLAMPIPSGEFMLDNVAALSSRDLQILLKDIGMHELAMALKGVDRRSLGIIFNRLSIEDARGLQQRIRSLVDVHPTLLKEAKYTVLEVNLSEASPEDLIFEIGLAAFAKALRVQDAAIFPLIRQKIEPRRSYSLRRYIDQHAPSNYADIVAMRKVLILKRIETLSKGGLIDESIHHNLSCLQRQESQSPEKTADISSNKGEALPSKSFPEDWHGKDNVL